MNESPVKTPGKAPVIEEEELDVPLISQLSYERVNFEKMLELAIAKEQKFQERKLMKKQEDEKRKQEHDYLKQQEEEQRMKVQEERRKKAEESFKKRLEEKKRR